MREKKIRFIYMFFLGIIIAFVISKVMPHPNEDHHEFFDYLMSIIITFVVWEGNLRIDSWLNNKITWLQSPLKRLGIQFVISVIFSSIGTYIPMKAFNTFVCVIPAELEGVMMNICLGAGIGVSIILLTVEISTQFFKNWKASLVEIEHYKTESVQAQLQNLKNQVNPHFLFNNLSVLSSLVYKDQDKAVDFINQLSKVYRYLLDNHSSELITLDEEMTFIRSYIYLLEIRFDKNIKFQIDIANECLHKLIPPMALQILIENTIKHNEASERLPLQVSVIANFDTLEVSNNMQLRSNQEPSSKSGLKNIKERYKFYTDAPVQVFQDSKIFKVTLPLFNKS